MKSPKVPCGICCKNVNVNQKNLLCNKCDSKVHIKCNDISVLEYEKLLNDQSNGVPWFCKNCTIDDRALMFPFGTVDNEVFPAYKFSYKFVSLYFLIVICCFDEVCCNYFNGICMLWNFKMK